MLRTLFAIFAFFAANLSVFAAEQETLPPGAKIKTLEITPAGELALTHRFDYRQLLVTAVTENGERIDVTRLVKHELGGAQPDAVTFSKRGILGAAKDGAAELKLSLPDSDAAALTIPVKVSGAADAVHPDFIRDVNPVMTKLGCNQGTCHGGAQGKNGFKLSLRGYDPVFDIRSLTDDLTGRRFNRVMPDQSLMLLKPSGVVPHVGGVLCKPGDSGYEILRAWIADGLPFKADAARVTGIAVEPQNPTIPLPKMKQQFRVIATYADNTTRDVTADAFVECGNIEVLEADKSGLVTALRRGESPILVRYEGAYAATTVTVMGDRAGFVWNNPPTNNYIDELVYAKLQKVKVLPSELCTDDEFLRRVYLDLTGLPPTSDVTRAFLADSRESRQKREELIDRLVGSSEYVEHWTNKWADMLQVNSKFLGEQGAWAMRNWIRQAIASNMPYDKFVYDVLTARGSTVETPAAGYFKTLREPDVVMENTTQLFLGVRFSCNKCHDHPFERWTQDQHWQLAAYFAHVQRKEDPQYAGQKIGGSAVEGAVPLVEVIYDGTTGEVKHPNSNAVMKPAVPYQTTVGAKEKDPSDSKTNPVLREQFARWATSGDNEYFAKSYVNRVWSYLTGVGFIEPVDDIRAGNPPTNPALLDRLTKEFLDSGCDVQHLIKLICKSRVYQHSLLSNRWNEDDAINYSHAAARRLPAEVLYDAVHQATGTTRKLSGLPAGSRAAMQRDPGNNSPDSFLDLFGRPARESSCECERVSGVMLGQTLNLVTGPTIAAAIADPSNELTKLVQEQQDDAKLVEELFLRFLNRYPTAKETAKGIAALQAADENRASGEKLRAEFQAREASLAQRQQEWESHQNQLVWTPLEFVEGTSAKGAKFTKQDDGSLLVEGPLDKDTYTLTFDTKQEKLTGLRLEALKDERLPANGPGRAVNGNFVLNELSLKTAPAAEPAKQSVVKLRGGMATFFQDQFNVKFAIDGNPDNGWAISPRLGENHAAAFEIERWPVEGSSRVVVTMQFNYTDGKHNLGRFRLAGTSSPPPLALTGPPDAIAAILAVPSAERSDEQRAALAKFFRANDSELARLETALAENAKLQSDPRLMGAQDLVWALINTPAFLFNR
jgi:hypothetical protein